jgi:TPR repeat protein
MVRKGSGGRTAAMIQLGDFYRRGLGVAKDPTQARQWIEKAAAAGDASASKALEATRRGR